MRWVGQTIAAVGALALLGVASGAQAQTVKRPAVADPGVAARDAYTLNQSQSRQVLEIEAAKRLGLKVEIQPPVTRGAELKDYEAGVFYKLSPGLSLGGAIGLADKEPPERQTKKEQVTPRVKIGGSLKF